MFFRQWRQIKCHLDSVKRGGSCVLSLLALPTGCKQQLKCAVGFFWGFFLSGKKKRHFRFCLCFCLSVLLVTWLKVQYLLPVYLFLLRENLLLNASLCSPAGLLLCRSGVWCWAGSIQQIYQSFFTEDSCQPRLELNLMRALRRKWNSQFVGCKKHKNTVLKEDKLRHRAKSVGTLSCLWQSLSLILTLQYEPT